MGPRFVYDEAKSQANELKHGIDFVEAQELWKDVRLLRRPARDGVERRLIFVGMIGQRHWAAVVTYRGSLIRLISVRRARPEEVRAYGR